MAARRVAGVRVAIALAMAIASVGVGHAAPSAAVSCLHARSSGAGWTTVDAPFPGASPTDDASAGDLASPRQTSFVINAGHPQDLTATDGALIRHSGDAGCTWTQVFNLTSVPPGAQSLDPGYVISSLTVAPRASQQPYVYALITEWYDALLAPVPSAIAVSTDGGASWTVPTPPPTADIPGGAPPCTPASTLTVAPDDPQVAYLDCEQALTPNHKGNGLYVTTDGARTWRLVSSTMPALSFRSNLVAGPQHRSELWFLADAAHTGDPMVLNHSTNGGASWTQKPLAYPYQLNQVDIISRMGLVVGRPSATATQLVAWGGDKLFISRNSGSSWQRLTPPTYGGPPGVIEGVATDDARHRLFVIGDYGSPCRWRSRAWSYDISHSRWHPLPAPRTAPADVDIALSQIGSDAKARPTFFARELGSPTDCGTQSVHLLRWSGLL